MAPDAEAHGGAKASGELTVHKAPKRAEVDKGSGAAVFHVRVAIHGIDRFKQAPQNGQIEAVVSAAVKSLFGVETPDVDVNVDATRTDM